MKVPEMGYVLTPLETGVENRALLAVGIPENAKVLNSSKVAAAAVKRNLVCLCLSYIEMQTATKHQEYNQLKIL